MKAYALNITEDGRLTLTPGDMIVDTQGPPAPDGSPSLMWGSDEPPLSVQEFFAALIAPYEAEKPAPAADRQEAPPRLPEGEPPWGLRTMFVYHGCGRIDPYNDSLSRLYSHRSCLWMGYGKVARRERKYGLRAERPMLQSERLWIQRKDGFRRRQHTAEQQSKKFGLPFVTSLPVAGDAG
jgi:hypothetical protein